jgi:hypothetical protein
MERHKKRLEATEYSDRDRAEYLKMRMNRMRFAEEHFRSERFAQNYGTTWESFAEEISTNLKKATNPLEMHRWRLMLGAVNGCKQVFERLENMSKKMKFQNQPWAQGLFAERRVYTQYGDSDMVVAPDSVSNHAARVAKIVTQMGIADPECIITAGLHDLADWLGTRNGNVGVRGGHIANTIRSAFKGGNLGVDADAIMDHLENFAQYDNKNKATTKAVIQGLEEGGFGQLSFESIADFSPTAFKIMNDMVQARYCVKNDVAVHGDPGQYAPLHGQDTENMFPSVISTLSPREGMVPKIPELITYLAAASDHAYLPKVRKIDRQDGSNATNEDRQNISYNQRTVALGLFFGLRPYYLAMGGAPSRVADDLVYRAFFPQACRNIYDAADSLSQENGGNYFDDCAVAHGGYIRTVVGEFLQRNPDVTMVGDEDWYNRLEDRLSSQKAPTDDLLDPSEIYLEGFSVIEPPNDSILHRKPAASIMKKILDTITNPKKTLSSSLQPDKFEESGYMRNLLISMHDMNRCRVMAGTNVNSRLAQFISEKFMAMHLDQSKFPDLSSMSDHGEPFAIADETSNWATSMRESSGSELERMGELLEAYAHNDRGMHLVFRFPFYDSKGVLRRPLLNTEIVVTDIKRFLANEIDPSAVARIVYKIGAERIKFEANGLGEHGSDDLCEKDKIAVEVAMSAYKTQIARFANVVRRDFLGRI